MPNNGGSRYPVQELAEVAKGGSRYNWSDRRDAINNLGEMGYEGNLSAIDVLSDLAKGGSRYQAKDRHEAIDVLGEIANFSPRDEAAKKAATELGDVAQGGSRYVKKDREKAQKALRGV